MKPVRSLPKVELVGAGFELEAVALCVDAVCSFSGVALDDRVEVLESLQLILAQLLALIVRALGRFVVEVARWFVFLGGQQLGGSSHCLLRHSLQTKL